MIRIIETAVNAIAPMILLIGLGYYLKSIGFLSSDFIKTGNKFVFRLGLPVMLFVNVYDIENLTQMNWSVVIYCVVITFFLFFVGYLLTFVFTRFPERRGVLLQCTFRSNFAIIGLSLASALGGAQAVANASVISCVTIPLYNVLAVIALSVFLDTDGNNNNAVKSVLVNILKNPLIWGVLIGIVAVLIRQIQNSLFGSVIFSIKGNLKFLYSAMNQIKSLTTPLSLIVLGGQFTFSAVKALRREIVAGTLMRTVVAPFIGIGCAVILAATTSFHCDSDMYPALVALFGSPVAVSSAVMAGAMGNDEQLAGQLVVWTSIASIFTIFVQVCSLMYLGLIVV